MNFNFKHQRSFSIGIVLLLGLGTILTTANISCGNTNKASEYKRTPPDTVNTFVNFVSPLDWTRFRLAANQSYSTNAWRLTKDTLILDSVDANTMRKIWKRDTIYVFEVHLPPKDTIGGKRDSVIYPFITPKHILVDYNKNPNKP